MSNFIQVGTISDLTDGSMKEVTAQGRPILLARVGDKFYAADNICPHMGARLSQGTLQGSVVTCPRSSTTSGVRCGRPSRSNPVV